MRPSNTSSFHGRKYIRSSRLKLPPSWGCRVSEVGKGPPSPGYAGPDLEGPRSGIVLLTRLIIQNATTSRIIRRSCCLIHPPVGSPKSQWVEEEIFGF